MAQFVKMLGFMWKSIIGRALVNALAGWILLILYALRDGKSVQEAAVSGAIVVVLLIVRISEGGYDVQRAATGKISDADVPVASDAVSVIPK